MLRIGSGIGFVTGGCVARPGALEAALYAMGTN